MPSQLQQIIAFCSKRYDESRDSRPRLAKAHLAIVNFAYSLRIGGSDPERLLLDFINQRHDDHDLAKACQDVLEQLGSAHQPTARPPKG